MKLLGYSAKMGQLEQEVSKQLIQGANVVEYTGFFATTLPDEFPAMPFVNELPSTHQDMRLAWRQGVRTGINKGRLIEDRGVISDSIVRPSFNDIVTETHVTQWRRIARKLESIAISKGIENLYFITRPDLSIIVQVDSPIAFQLTCGGISSISMALGSESPFEVVIINDPSIKTSLNLTGNAQIIKPGFYTVNITGTSADGVELVSTNRFVQIVPAKKSWLLLKAESVWQLDSLDPAVAIFNIGDEANAGWFAIDKGFQLGNGTNYNDNTNSVVTIFVNEPSSVSKRIAISVLASFKTEIMYDFLSVGYKDSVGDHSLLSNLTNKDTRCFIDAQKGISGEGLLDEKYEFQVSGDFQIYIGFNSDGAKNEGTLLIKSLTVGYI